MYSPHDVIYRRGDSVPRPGLMLAQERRAYVRSLVNEELPPVPVCCATFQEAGCSRTFQQLIAEL